MRHVHARTGKDDAVYAVEFAVYQAPDKTESWEDKSILQFPKDTLASIEVAGLTLNRTPSATADKPTGNAGKVDKPAGKATWQINGLNQGEVVNETDADDLAGKLAQLRIGAVLGTKAKTEYGSDKPALTLKLTRKDGNTLEYQLGPTGKDQYAVLKTSARPEYFRLPSYTADGLIEAAGRAKLVQGAPAPPLRLPALQPQNPRKAAPHPMQGRVSPARTAPNRAAWRIIKVPAKLALPEGPS